MIIEIIPVQKVVLVIILCTKNKICYKKKTKDSEHYEYVCIKHKRYTKENSILFVLDILYQYIGKILLMERFWRFQINLNIYKRIYEL